MHINIDEIYVWIVKHYFSQICKRVTARHCCQNFVSAQCLENELSEFNQILYAHQH